MTEEEKAHELNKLEAENMKAKGNAAYKEKNFESALSFYEQAIQLDPRELTYYTNKAAVYFEMKEYVKCIECCD